MPAGVAISKELIFADAALARRIEAVEEFGDAEATRLLAQTRPECVVQVIGGGHMCFSGKESPIGRAHGMGFTGEVAESLVEEVEEFYHSRGAAAQIDLCPYVHPSLIEITKKRGFALAEFNTVLARFVGDEDFPIPPGVTIRKVKPEEGRMWSEIVDRGFGEGEPVGFAWLFESWAEMTDGICLLAEVDGKPAAGAAGLIVREHNVTGFFGAATLPRFRGRGVQMALLNARLAIAREAGTDLAVTLTMPGTASQRNAERAGFRVAFTKAVVTKQP